MQVSGSMINSLLLLESAYFLSLLMSVVLAAVAKLIKVGVGTVIQWERTCHLEAQPLGSHPASIT